MELFFLQGDKTMIDWPNPLDVYGSFRVPPPSHLTSNLQFVLILPLMILIFVYSKYAHNS